MNSSQIAWRADRALPGLTELSDCQVVKEICTYVYMNKYTDIGLDVKYFWPVQESEVRGQRHMVSTPGGQAGPVGPASGGGFWDEVKGIILERLRHGAPKEMGRGECLQVGLTEVFTLWG
jgi:hypothetical protein